MIGEIVGFIFVVFIGLVLMTMVAGELVGHAEVRRFLFWVRGRSEETGEPVRRLPLP